MRKSLLFSTIIASLVFTSCSKGTEKPSGQDAGKTTQMPAFTLKDLNGNDVSSDSFRGKILMVDFWATWCPPCVGEVPDLNELYDAYKDKGFELVGVATQSGDAAAIRSSVKKLGIQYTVLVGTNEVAGLYGVYAFPTDFIIDRKGDIREHMLGAPPGKKDKVAGILDELLAE